MPHPTQGLSQSSLPEANDFNAAKEGPASSPASSKQHAPALEDAANNAAPVTPCPEMVEAEDAQAESAGQRHSQKAMPETHLVAPGERGLAGSLPGLAGLASLPADSTTESEAVLELMSMAHSEPGDELMSEPGP